MNYMKIFVTIKQSYKVLYSSYNMNEKTHISYLKIVYITAFLYGF